MDSSLPSAKWSASVPSTQLALQTRKPGMEQIMRFHVRLFQLKHWFGGQDMFSVCGQLRKSERDTGGVTWKDMSAFKKPFVSPAPPRVQQEVAGEMVDVVTLD